MEPEVLSLTRTVGTPSLLCNPCRGWVIKGKFRRDGDRVEGVLDGPRYSSYS